MLFPQGLLNDGRNRSDCNHVIGTHQLKCRRALCRVGLVRLHPKMDGHRLSGGFMCQAKSVVVGVLAIVFVGVVVVLFS